MVDFSPVRRYIADASNWLYLIHLPIVMVLQAMVAARIAANFTAAGQSSCAEHRALKDEAITTRRAA
jgi:hypothetical protein